MTMIDIEDFKPQIKALGQIKLTIDKGDILQATLDRMIRGLRNWPKEIGTPTDNVRRRAYIEQGFMLGLAAVTEHQWTRVDWEDLRGCAPDATGNLSSEAFVRQLRDEWH